MSLRKQLKSYPDLRRNLKKLRNEREACLNGHKEFSVDMAIDDMERQIDAILAQIACVSDEQAKCVMFDHFIVGKSVRDIGKQQNYSIEWVYKKISKGITEIEAEKRMND